MEKVVVSEMNKNVLLDFLLRDGSEHIVYCYDPAVGRTGIQRNAGLADILKAVFCTETQYDSMAGKNQRWHP